ncbi:cytochrome c-type biogenesis protein [Labrys neptuniae]
MLKRLFLIFILGLASLPALALQPDEVLPDPALEARARALSAQLRCLVCQNESIDDSNATLARDLRILVRERLKAGDSDQAIKDFLVARYGEFVLLKPPLEPRTLLLWIGPPGLLVIGGIAILWSIRRRRVAAPAPLSAEEQARIDDILKREG